MKKRVLSGVLAAAVMALIVIPAARVAAQPVSQLFSVFVHLQYADGTSYDVPLRTGVPMAEVTPMLQDCGRSHQQGSVVRYHCYSVPE